jgi:hypothetical protein
MEELAAPDWSGRVPVAGTAPSSCGPAGDYTPIVSASTVSRRGSDSSSMRLSIRCRAGRTELVVTGSTVSRRSEGNVISYRTNNGQPVRLPVTPPWRRVRKRRRAPDAVTPRGGRLRPASFHAHRRGVRGTFFARRPEDGSRETGDGVPMATGRCHMPNDMGRMTIGYYVLQTAC